MTGSKRAALVVLLIGCSKTDPATTDGGAAASSGSVTAATSALAAVGSVRADTASFTGALRGTLDGKHAIVMHLMQTGKSAKSDTLLEGFYYYAPAIDDLSLKGTASPDGTVHLEESSAGKLTGAFDGHLNGHDSLDGTWTDPKKTKSLPFHLDLVRANAAAVIVERKQVSKHKPTTAFDKTQFAGDPVCDVNVTFPDVLGALGSDAAEIKLAHALRENAIGFASEAGSITTLTCELPATLSATYNVHTNGSAILSLVQSVGVYNYGMAGPTYGNVFTNLALPSGKPFALKDVVTPAGIALADGRVMASLPKDVDADSKKVVTDALAADPPDFAVTKNGLSLSIFSAQPKSMQGMAFTEVPVALNDLEAVRVRPSPVDSLWGK